MWYDSEVYGGHAKSNVAAQDIYYGPENKMKLPCDSCSLVDKCASNVTECSAFKTWTTYGYYDSQKVGKLVKKVAQKGLRMKLDRHNISHRVALEEAYYIAMEKGLEGDERTSFIEKKAMQILNETGIQYLKGLDNV